MEDILIETNFNIQFIHFTVSTVSLNLGDLRLTIGYFLPAHNLIMNIRAIDTGFHLDPLFKAVLGKLVEERISMSISFESYSLPPEQQTLITNCKEKKGKRINAFTIDTCDILDDI